ncbi:DUF6077 domain-containing protein [Blastococcus tunisiensis]|uniref:4-amino-4-deoxy-L-arabinose transferase n=1 Tax=Blastococcus tunisiensis TaxID=1798228 RepID=A0A1I1WHX2_9ACTN|nr:DUF6077 domain-containing protein [Blastococcus sp. DSM 46838]SFD94795.1 hypothetical protein SAMN05216574_101390 [Blastococcus sp. DSM 46838]
MSVPLLDRPPDAGGPAGRAPLRRARLVAFADLTVLSGVAVFAGWCVCYLVALAGVAPSSVAFWTWLATAPLVVAATVRWLRPVLAGIPAASPWPPLALALGAAVGSLLVVRPDLDDASYVVRSTWIAAHGDVRVGDVLFSDGAWPGLAAQTPYLPSIEALLGWVARVSGLSAGTVVYVLFPPVVAAGAVWALWMLLRAWGVRRPGACLALAGVFLVFGGATAASWGNLHLGRIWQGKVVFLALVVPLLYAVVAALWKVEGERARRAALLVTALLGVASVGLTPAAIFVVPGVVLVALVPGLLARRPALAGAAFAAGAGPALAAGAVTVLAGEARGIGLVDAAAAGPWAKVLGTGIPAAVVVVAAVVVLLGGLWPRWWSGADAAGRWTAAAAVGAGLLIAVPVLYDVAVAVMGTDAIAWRLTWIVPVPALVGMLAAIPGGPRRLPLGVPVAVVVAGALVWGGVPLWSTTNGARLAPAEWKISPAHLKMARWVAAQEPAGRVAAPVESTAALGVVTADVRRVGSRPAYMADYADLPGAQMAERGVLQRLADGGAAPADLAAAPAALTALDVQIVCTFADAVPLLDLLGAEGYEQRFSNGALTCVERRAAG